MATITVENFGLLHRINWKLVRTEYLYEWAFRLDISGAPVDFDFYVKDISYNVLDVSTDEARYGAATYNWPVGRNVMRCSMTVRDSSDGRMQKFFTDWSDLAFPSDGTVNPPFATNANNKDGKGYTKEVSLFEVKPDNTEIKHWTYTMYPITVGEVSRSRENGNFFEIPVTLTEFSSII